ncbi:MAG: hypothetical protein M3N54_08035 [Acidobacteriota bacterium]|nr:hypothetical protein [Acidobacteriota bacterium]
MIQYRRLSALLLGAWLGAGVFADVAVTQNFQTVDRFLDRPGSVSSSRELNSIGRARERLILRRNAGEENNAIFENWERVELVAGIGLFFILLFGSRPSKPMLAGALLMVLIVAVQHFLLSPAVTDLGRQIADLPAENPLNAKFWTYHGIYSGAEILKLVVGAVLAVRLSIRRKQDPDHFAKKYATKMAASVNQSG